MGASGLSAVARSKGNLTAGKKTKETTMPNLKRMLTASAISVLLLPPGASAEQLTKRGTYSGVYGFYANTGETVSMGKDHAVWAGVSSGAFRNDAGSGFLHAAIVKCTFSIEGTASGLRPPAAPHVTR